MFKGPGYYKELQRALKLDMVLCNLLEHGGWTRGYAEIPANLNQSVKLASMSLKHQYMYVTTVEDFIPCQNSMDNEQQQNHSTSVCSNQHQTENGITIICSMLSQGDEKQTLTPTPSSKKKKKKATSMLF